jgi:saccharopine dehydrogenase-like NADP-dependent oxidoreductase
MRVLMFGAGGIGSLHAGNLVRAAEASEVLVADIDAVRAEALAVGGGGRPPPGDSGSPRCPEARGGAPG